MWLAVEHLGLSPEGIASCFEPYRPEKWTAGLALDNLAAKLGDADFRNDLAALVPDWPDAYTIDAGAEVAQRVVAAVAPDWTLLWSHGGHSRSVTGRYPQVCPHTIRNQE